MANPAENEVNGAVSWDERRQQAPISQDTGGAGDSCHPVVN